MAARALRRKLIAALLAAVPASMAGATGTEPPGAELLLFLAEFGEDAGEGGDALAAGDPDALPEALLNLLEQTDVDDREHDPDDDAPRPAPRRR